MRTYDPTLLDLKLITDGFNGRFGAAPSVLAERMKVVTLFMGGSTPARIAVTMRLRLGQVNRVLSFAQNLSARCNRSGKPDPNVAAFTGLSLRVQNVLAALGITTVEEVRAMFDSKGHLIRTIPKLGPTSIMGIARWLGLPNPPRAALQSAKSDAQLARAIALLERNGYTVTLNSEGVDTTPLPQTPFEKSIDETRDVTVNWLNASRPRDHHGLVRRPTRDTRVDAFEES